MMSDKHTRPGRLRPPASRARVTGWRDAARGLARRLMPAIVLAAAAVLGLAAVALA